LAQEVELLSRAETELHRGRYANALRLLDDYRREFPNGTLSQERLAARIQALCALGRQKEAEADLARLTRLSPESPQEGRARAACAAKN
jgi:outer membrane protein assembly factor BamD (BamD/ComL family)